MIALILALSLPAPLADRADAGQLQRLSAAAAQFESTWAEFEGRRAQVLDALSRSPDLEALRALISPFPGRRTHTLEPRDAEWPAIEALAHLVDPAQDPESFVDLCRAYASRRRAVGSKETELWIWLARAAPGDLRALGAPSWVFPRREEAMAEGPRAALEHLERVTRRLQGPWALIQVKVHEASPALLVGSTAHPGAPVRGVRAALAQPLPAWTDDGEDLWVLGRLERSAPALELTSARVLDLRFLRLPALLQAIRDVGQEHTSVDR